MSTLEHLKVDVLFILGVIISFIILFYYRPLIDDIHALFLLVGTLILAVAFAVTKVGVDVPKIQNVMVATAIGNVVLGLPSSLGKSPDLFIRVPLPELTVGVFAEEVFRIAVAVWIFETSKSSTLASILAGLAFAAIHIYWQPTQWVTAILAGFLLTFLLFIYGNPIACVGSHTMFNFYMMGYISALAFFGSSLVMGLLGYAIMKIGGT